MRTTKHKNGLNLVWNDIFFLYALDEPLTVNYHAYVQAESYRFEQINSANHFIMTPAQQLMWVPAQGDENMFKYVLSPFARQWLEQNIGERGPEWFARDKPFDLMFHSILFRRRKDALRFIQYLNGLLKERVYED